MMLCLQARKRRRRWPAGALGALILALALWPARPASAQGMPFLIKDINTTIPELRSSNPGYLAAAGNTVYFQADHPMYGKELWKSDGTVAGTALVRDIYPGMNSSNPANLAAAGSTLYFAAADGMHGTELWKTDGTVDGTVMVKDIAIGQNGSFPSRMVALNGTIYFSANDGSASPGHGTELWRSDGTAAGTWMVKDVDPGTGSGVSDFVVLNGKIYFASRDASTFALWQSDGSAAGTVKVASLGDGYASQIISRGGKLFVADSKGNYWVSDGTAGGTVRFFNSGINYDSHALDALAILNDWIFFPVVKASYSTTNPPAITLQTTLWKSDGTSAGTRVFKNLEHQAMPDSLYRPEMITLGGALYFTASDETHGWELWKSNGTDAGTGLFKDLNPGSGDSNPAMMRVIDGKLYFAARDGAAGTEWWLSDGTTAGTRMIKDVNPGPGSGMTNLMQTYYYGPINYPVAAGGKLFFNATDGVHGIELWSTDGTAAGTVMARDIAVGSDSTLYELTGCGGDLYFSANDPHHGRELWKSDGSAAGTRRVADLTSGSAYSYIYILNRAGKRIFFSRSSAGKTHLGASDGTAAGTFILPATGQNIKTAVVGDTLYFALSPDYSTPTMLWKSDGTPSGTVKLRDGSSPGMEAHIVGLFEFKGALYFLEMVDGKTRLMTGDGTTTGSVMVADTLSYYYDFTAVPAGEKFYGYFSRGYYPQPLWVSDGTSSGTRKVSDIPPAQYDYHAVLDGKLIFNGITAGYGEELWISDGVTSAGTKLVKDLWPGGEGSRPKDLIRMGRSVFFAASDPDHGQEIWKTDGTAAGTMMLKDICPGPSGSWPSYLVDAGGLLAFSAYSPKYGTEIWVSDGTPQGTRLLADLSAGPAGSNPTSLTVVDGMVFFTGIDGNNLRQGRELWAFRLMKNAVRDWMLYGQ